MMTSEELQDLRRSIDNCDAALIHVLAERFRVTRAVGRLKAERSLPPADPVREEAQVARLRALAESAGLDADFAERLIRTIMAEVVVQHERLIAAVR